MEGPWPTNARRSTCAHVRHFATSHCHNEDAAVRQSLTALNCTNSKPSLCDSIVQAYLMIVPPVMQ